MTFRVSFIVYFVSSLFEMNVFLEIWDACSQLFSVMESKLLTFFFIRGRKVQNYIFVVVYLLVN